jgi:pimeloyl-ACP methyl ester carboxylesterase
MMHLLLRRSRRSFSLALAVVVAMLVAGVLARVAQAQAQTQQAPVSFVYLRGADTLGVETITPGTGTVLGSLRYKGQPRVDWEQVREPLQLTMKVFAPRAAESAAPAQSLVFRPRGDSVVLEMTGNGQSVTQRFASKAGAVPVIPSSVLHMALLSQYARSIGKTTLPMFQTAGAQTMDVGIVFSGDTSIVTIAGLQMRTVWADGVPNESTIAAQNLRVVRATGTVKPPSSAPEKIDYSAPAGAPYTADNVVIPTTRGYTLAGTLTKPKGMAKVPVVITISGSGPQERDERLGAVVPGYALFREVADTLGRRGVAVLRYDDRGVGESGGADSRAKATSADFADDVLSVVAYLRTRPDVDGSRILVAGHSEGGLIGPLAAAKDPSIRAVAMMAGPAYDGRRILQFQIGNQFKALIAANSSADSGLANARTRGENLEQYAMRRTDTMIDSMSAEPWMGYFVKANPKATLRKLRQPVLVLQGGTDMQVTPEQADTVAAVLKAAGNNRVTMRTFPATNHLFVPDPVGAPSGYQALKDVRVRREVLGALAEWVVQIVK